MTEDQLRTFEAFVRGKHLKSAADTLQISPSTALARMKALEDELGGSLIRHGRTLEATPLGKDCLPLATAALTALQQMRAVAAAQHSNPAEDFTIAATPILTSRMMPLWFKDWPRSRRGVQIKVCHSPQVVEAVDQGEARAGFAFDVHVEGKSLQVHSLGTDQLLCVIPHHWSSWVDTDDLTARGPFIICTSDQPLWITLRKALYLSRRFPPKPWIAVDDLEGARALILSGMGWGILPLTLIAEDLRARTVQVWENPPWKLPSRHCVVLWRRDCEDPFDRTTLQAWQRVMQAGRGNT